MLRSMFGRSMLVTHARKSALKCPQIFKNKTTPLASGRFKYTQYNGVKGIRKTKNAYECSNSNVEDVEENNDDGLKLQDRAYDELVSNTMNVQPSNKQITMQNVLVIQPYIKWGSQKNHEITPNDQLKEAEALIRSLPNWTIAQSLKIPLESLKKKTLFGSGKMQELKALLNRQKQIKPLTCIFVSVGTLSFIQKRILDTEFGIPVMDRYSIVIQILRLHATSAEARIQVAMAEIPYIWMQVKDENVSLSRKQGYFLTDTQKELLRKREKKLKLELDKIRVQRQLLRKKRTTANFPIVAVVGYTNAGKTSLIKALSNEAGMEPRNQLFATLDVTAHAGLLPCNLEVIYMDTVGFMSDLPTGLIECFVATLEDAMMADVLIHVQDMSHKCVISQSKHVETTLQSLVNNIDPSNTLLPPIINVGNKIDLVPQNKLIDNSIRDDMYMVSAETGSGIDDLLAVVERKILDATGRKKMKLRVPNGGSEMAWLYKNAAVTEMSSCEKNAEYLIMNVVISERRMEQFKQNFCK